MANKDPLAFLQAIKDGMAMIHCAGDKPHSATMTMHCLWGMGSALCQCAREKILLASVVFIDCSSLTLVGDHLLPKRICSRAVECWHCPSNLAGLLDSGRSDKILRRLTPGIGESDSPGCRQTTAQGSKKNLLDVSRPLDGFFATSWPTQIVQVGIHAWLSESFVFQTRAYSAF